MQTRDHDGNVTPTGLVLGLASLISFGTFMVPVLYLVNGGSATAVLDRLSGISWSGGLLIAAFVTAIMALWGRTFLMVLDVENQPGGFAGWFKRETGCDCMCRALRRACDDPEPPAQTA